MKLLIIILAIMLFFNGLGLSGYSRNQAYSTENQLVFSVKDMPYNHTFSYWVEKWFHWFLSFPVSPRENYSSTICSQSQNSADVWMLADGDDQSTDNPQGEIRDCKIPAGKALLVQIVGSNCSTDEGGDTTDQGLLKCAQWILNDSSLRFHANVDGIEVMNTEKNPIDKEKFYVKPFFTNLTYPQNKYGATPGTFRGTEAGYFLFVKPLELGNHTISFDEHVKKRADTGEYDQRTSAVKYNLQIVNMTK